MIVIGIVTASGLISYQRLSGIIGSIDSDLRPDRRLLISKEILTDISDAENAVKTYSITQEEAYLEAFYVSVNHTGSLLYRLRNIGKADDSLLSNVDSLEGLVEQKFKNLESLITLQNNDVARKALDRLSTQLESDKTQDQQPEKEQTFWNKLFNKEGVVAEEESSVSLSEINKKLEAVKEEEAAKEKALREQELKLIQADRDLMLKLRGLVATIEKNETERLASLALEAKTETRETTYFIAIFCIAIGVLLVLATISIFRFVKNNNKYKQVLRDSREKALNLAQAKEKFMANMSHEIRTPMNAIVGFTDQLAEKIDEPEQKAQLKMVQNSSSHLLQIVNDLLDFTKLEAGKLKLEKRAADPRKLANDVLEMVGGLAEKKGLKLEYLASTEVPERVLLDPLRMRQVLLNLVTNSIKFTHQGSVRLEMFVEELAGIDYLVFHLNDTGIGMNPQDLVKVFEEFEQADNPDNHEIEGTGLGMSISKRLINLHDGQVELASETDKGTSVIVKLPLFEIRPEHKEEEKASGKKAEKLSGLNLLLVDDEPFNRSLLRAIFDNHDVSYKEASDGNEAIAALEKESFDIVLLDMRMPNLDGIGATQKIRASKTNYKDVPIIALSAAGTNEDLRMYKREGIQGYVPKPFKADQLIEEISSILSKKQEKTMNSEDRSKTRELLYSTEGLEAMANGNTAFVKEMLNDFLSSVSKSIETLDLCLEEEDKHGIREAAHKICGPASHLAANQLYKTVKELEMAAKDEKRIELLADMVEDTHKQFEVLEEQMRRDINNM